MRLNKEPPEDTPVVEFVGVSETTSPSSLAPLSAHRGAISGVVRGLQTGARNGDAGAEATAAVAELAIEEKDAQEEELKKIKGSELGDDDNCVVCLSGEMTVQR